MKVAIVHDWLTGMRGGERCLAQFLTLYPDADLFTLLHVPGSTTTEIDQAVRSTSFLQVLPGVKKYYRGLLPLYPAAARSLKVEGYDLVISLSHAAAKNVEVHGKGNTVHVCYCFTPMRYIWDQSERYFGRATQMLKPLLTSLRNWDRSSAAGVDQFVAISSFVEARIRCFYGAKSQVIYPPVDFDWIDSALGAPVGKLDSGEAFLCAGALVPYKRIDLVVESFNRNKLPLWIVGKGPEEQKLRSMAGDNIKFIGAVSDQELATYYRRCKALIFPGTEDFGMMPVECMAAGRPIIAAYCGGAKETVRGLKCWPGSSQDLPVDQATGVFYLPVEGSESAALEGAVKHFLAIESEIRADSCRRQAEKFSVGRFYREWLDLCGGLAPVSDCAKKRIKAEQQSAAP